MAKLWKVLKVIIFSVGALTLALLLYGLIQTFVFPLFRSHGHLDQEAKAPSEEVVFEKKDGGLKLLVKRKETTDGPDAYLITLTKGGTHIVQNYRLPTEKYHLEGVSFYDAALVPVRENEYRIVLFSSYEEEEGGSESHVWFLKMTDAMNVREVMQLSDVHTTESKGLVILGNRYYELPYQENFRSRAFVVPVMVRVGDSIRVSPLLSPEGAETLHTALEQEIKARMASPSDGGKEEKSGEQCQQVRKEMDEALSERTIAY